MAVVNFKSAMPSMGGAAASSSSASKGGSSMTKYVVIALLLAGAGYLAYNHFFKPKATNEDDN
jgi:hypothetical protein